MRIADKMAYNQVTRNLSKNRAEMAELQNQAATQKRVTKPSDDPVAASRVLSSRLDLQGNQQYLKNLDYAKSFLEVSEQSLGELAEHLVRVKELALSQASDASANPNSRNVVATEVAQIYNQIVQIGNRKLGDRYIFGGYRTQQAPFNTKGAYFGDKGEMMIPVGKGDFVAMNVPGSKIFEGLDLSGDGVSHATTLQPTTIEEMVVENRQVKEQKDQAMSSESEGESLSLRHPSSLEEARSQTQKEKSGINLFDVLSKLDIALRSNDKVGVQEVLTQIDEAHAQVVLARAQVGSRVMVLNSTMESLNQEKVDSQIHISSLEDVDAFEIVSDMNKKESSLKATLATSGKLVQPTLLDFLR